MFLPRLLAAFYLGQSSAAGDEPASASRREELGPILAGWASEFFAAPNPASRAALLSALEFHAGRASTAKAEAKLIALVTQEVLEPLSHFDRGLARALIGDREGAQKESADAASRIRDPQARALLQQAVEKILGWEVTASTRR